MRLCMFHPRERPMERGWVGRIDSDRVVHLAAQTLQSFFLGGGAAREHAEYALDDAALLAPVLHPPAVRIFEADDEFFFANPAAILSPGAEAHVPRGAEGVTSLVRPAAVVGAEGVEPPKDRDFALFLGPWVETDFVAQSHNVDFDWERALAHAAENTQLRAGDLVAAPAVQRAELDVGPFELAVEGLGTLAGRLG